MMLMEGNIVLLRQNKRTCHFVNTSRHPRKIYKCHIHTGNVRIKATCPRKVETVLIRAIQKAKRPRKKNTHDSIQAGFPITGITFPL